jgi:hypothetical protein
MRVMRFLRAFTLIALVSSAFLLPSEARATPVLDFTGGIEVAPVTYQTLGWEFSLATALTIDAFGVWDEGANGLAASHIVALWSTAGGAPLAQVTVTGGSTPFASTQSAGRWMFEDLLTPLFLAPGNYVLGADYQTGADLIRTEVASLALAPGISFVELRFATIPTVGLDFPNATFSTSVGHFGPNFSVAAAVDPSPVPEPATMTMLGIGLGGMALRRFRRKA